MYRLYARYVIHTAYKIIKMIPQNSDNREANVDLLKDAQADMRVGYAYGSTGVLASGIIWLLSGLVVHFYSTQRGILTLILGGMFIFPFGILLDKLIGIRGPRFKSNPLSTLAMEGTIWMIMCIPLSYGLSMLKAEWFFQGMLLIIAGRYLTFASIYGTRLYWILGALLGLAAYTLFFVRAGSFVSAVVGGTIEIVFGLILFTFYKRSSER
jgi:hypothetical protein